MKKNKEDLLLTVFGGKIKKEQWMVIFLAGILLFVIALPEKKKEEVKTETGSAEPASLTGQDEEERYCKNMEKKLEEILSRIDGAGETKVMITLKDFGEEIVEKDKKREQNTSEIGTEQRQEMTEEEETIYGTMESGREQPYISKKIQPKIAGVLVLCEGGEKVFVRKNISEAVLALFEVEVHNIKIEKMKRKGEE